MTLHALKLVVSFSGEVGRSERNWVWGLESNQIMVKMTPLTLSFLVR